MAVIEARDIRHVYEKGTPNETVAIDHIDLTLEDGTANALLGPSGCGKTTLLKIVSGLLTPTQGQILIDGEDVTEQSPAERDVAQVFQFPIIYDSMSVYDNLAFPLRNGGVGESEIKDRVHEIADLLDLTDILQQSPAKFGPEMRQLMALGRGIIRADTSAILFDEPMTDVEPYRKLEIRRRVKEAQQAFNLTSLYVTHDQHEALTFAEKVAIMKDGELVQYDTGKNLYQNPTNTFIGHFIGSPGMNLFDCEIGGDEDEPKAVLGGYSIALPEDVHPKVDLDWTDCQLGIRPSSIGAEMGEPDDSTEYLPSVVDQVEIHGGFRIITSTLKDSDIEILTRVAHDFQVEEGDEVWLHLPREDVRLFHHEQAVEPVF